MLNWLQTFGSGASGLREINARFLEMLQDGRHIFDAAANALLSGGDPEVIREDLFRTDARINQTEQQIRREIVVHGTIHGAATFPVLLTMMSLVKDAERVGDYAKNLFDLAALRPDMDPADIAELTAIKDQVSNLLIRAHGIFKQQEVASAKEFLEETDGLQNRCDARVEYCIKSADRNRVAEVLAYRYCKRVASHVGNIVTSVVMPVDKLDYFPNKPMSEQ
ncbi:MAG: phosphate transport system protein [Chlamydiales bacterium]|jgi:phosphate transport system protein